MILSVDAAIADLSNVGLGGFLGEHATTVLDEPIKENHTGNHTGRVNHRNTVYSGRQFAWSLLISLVHYKQNTPFSIRKLICKRPFYISSRNAHSPASKLFPKNF